MPLPMAAQCATLNIELQKRTPARHRGNYYACDHCKLRTNNPELRVERADRERERELKICAFLVSHRSSCDHRKSQANLSLMDLAQYNREGIVQIDMKFTF